MKNRSFFTLLAICGTVTACAQPEVILPGKRENVWSTVDYAAPLDVSTKFENTTAPANFATPVVNSNWPQAVGTAQTRTNHPAFSQTPRLLWSTEIGTGDENRKRIVADPISAGGLIFTMDADMRVQATDINGQPVWNRDLTPKGEDAGDAIGGGLAYGGGHVFVSTAYGELTALDPKSGQIRWQQRLAGTGSGAPTYFQGLVYVVANDATAWAIETDSGRVRWQIDGQSDVNNLSGSVAPSLSEKFAIFPYGSGELQAAFRKGGLVYWNTALSGARSGRAIGEVDDIAATPFISGNRVYSGNGSGRVASIDLTNGDRIWTQNQGVNSQIWAVGDSVFFVNDLNQIVRINAKTGAVIWARDLPRYLDKNPKKSVAQVVHHGPVVAGGNVVLTSSDGFMRIIDPASGQTKSQIVISGGSTTNPIVVNKTLYVVSGDGKLHAFR